MASPGLGHKSILAMGKESAFGTAVTSTLKFEIINWNIAPTIGVIQDASLTSTGQSRRAIYQGGRLWKGTFTVRMNYAGMLELFRSVLPTYTSPVIEAATVWDHTFKEGATLPSYTMEVSVGDIPAGKVFRLTGCKLTTVVIKGSAGTGADAMLQAYFSVVAQDCISNQSPTGSPTVAALLPVLYHQAIGVDDGVTVSTFSPYAGQIIKSFELHLENPHSEDRYYLGAVNVAEPLRSDFMVAKFKFVEEFADQAMYDVARSFTNGSPSLVFQHPTTIGSSSKREIEIRAGSANLTSFSAPVSGYGVVVATVEWDCWRDATDGSCVVIRNRSGDAILT